MAETWSLHRTANIYVCTMQEPRGAYGEDLELGSDGGYSEISDISQHRKMTGAPEPFTLLGEHWREEINIDNGGPSKDG